MAQDNEPKSGAAIIPSDDDHRIGDALDSMSIDCVRRLVREMEAEIAKTID